MDPGRESRGCIPELADGDGGRSDRAATDRVAAAWLAARRALREAAARRRVRSAICGEVRAVASDASDPAKAGTSPPRRGHVSREIPLPGIDHEQSLFGHLPDRPAHALAAVARALRAAVGHLVDAE